jgi:hypothetical protein
MKLFNRVPALLIVYHKGLEKLATKTVASILKQSADIAGAEEVLLKDARLIFIASIRRAVARALK